jgi:hypothetical protein
VRADPEKPVGPNGELGGIRADAALPRTAKQVMDEDLPGMGQFYCELSGLLLCRVCAPRAAPQSTVSSALQHALTSLVACPCRSLAGVETGKWFVDAKALAAHKKSRFYKMRVKELKGAAPHSQRDAEAAVGLGVDNGPKLGRDPRPKAMDTD